MRHADRWALLFERRRHELLIFGSVWDDLCHSQVNFQAVYNGKYDVGWIRPLRAVLRRGEQ